MSAERWLSVCGCTGRLHWQLQRKSIDSPSDGFDPAHFVACQSTIIETPRILANGRITMVVSEKA